MALHAFPESEDGEVVFVHNQSALVREQVRTAVRRSGLTRARVSSVRAGFDRGILALRRREAHDDRARILCYHSVGTPQWGVNDVQPKRFRRQLESALAAGYIFVPASDIARTGGQPKQLAVTFDDGLTSVATNAAPILASLGVPWTLFVVSGWADGQSGFPEGLLLGWREIDRLAGRGVEIGSHTVTHTRLSTLSAGEVERELGESRATIEARIGVRPAAFAIPVGRRRDWPDEAMNVAHAVGYETVYAACEEARPSGTVARTMITSWDGDRIFNAALEGAYDQWEEWIL